MNLTDRDVGQLSPLVREDVETVALWFADRHRSHLHIQHQVRGATYYKYLIAALTGSVSPPFLRHLWHFEDKPCRYV